MNVRRSEGESYRDKKEGEARRISDRKLKIQIQISTGKDEGGTVYRKIWKHRLKVGELNIEKEGNRKKVTNIGSKRQRHKKN